MAGTDTDDDLPDVPMSDTLKHSSADRLKDADVEEEKGGHPPARSDGFPRREFCSIALGGAIAVSYTHLTLPTICSV